MRSFKTASTDRLFKVIADLKTVEECYDFFEDLCTIKEIQDMSQRLDTAILLSTGKSYQKIAEEISVSTATISRVNKCLEYGSGGYRAVIDKINGGKK
ncbi:MAG: TrpR-related protein YerC/YecD [Clostridia bacterium]|nr:TrpR-related protein YerC/YecD [Clostridia bacterium]MBR4979034.1 TrpR-related protein YerC/YecD [Clostridia bacterium]